MRLEAPKSANLMVPSFATSTFAPLMSRCAMPLRCSTSSPSNSWRVYTRMTWPHGTHTHTHTHKQRRVSE